MFPFLRRSLYVLSNKIFRRHHPDKTSEEKWITDFSKSEKIPFDIKPENSFDAYRENGSLCLGLKKTNTIAWVDAPEPRFRNQIIEARLRLDNLGGYAAAGLMFRVVDDGTFYLALVSSKNYFRLDLMKNGSPMPLIGWTEVPVSEIRPAGEWQDIALTIAACGDHLMFFIGGHWIAEIHDASITEGHIGFAMASYETGSEQGESLPASAVRTCRAWMDFLSVDSRNKTVEEFCKKWDDSMAIPAESRFHLAETFAALGASSSALAQITKVWKQREEAGKSVTATYTETRTQKELLLAARMAARLERYDEAEEYLNACLELGRNNPEGEEAVIEKINLLDTLERFSELKGFIQEYINRKEDDPVLYAMLGRACWNLKEYEPAVAAWDRAFELDGENGFYLVNAANACVLLDKQEEALKRCLAGGRIFLRQGNNEELGALIPKLLSLGERDWEARALAGKWAFGVGDFERTESELVLSDKIRRKLRPQTPADPAVSYLRGMILVQKGKRREAFRFFAEAVRLAPDYGLFRFKLAETRYLLSGNARAPGLTADLQAALNLMPDDGWVHNFAAQVLLALEKPKAADLDATERHLQKSAAVLGEIPAVRVNRGTLCYLRGSLAEALRILSAAEEDDPEALTVHCAGKLLFRSGDFAGADAFYRRALAAAPDNFEYLSDRVACLIELKLLGRAEELLTRARDRNPSPEILELINRLAAEKKVKAAPAVSKAKKVSSSKAVKSRAISTKTAAKKTTLRNPAAAKMATVSSSKITKPRAVSTKTAASKKAEAAPAKRKRGRPPKNPPPVNF
ncbi:MAG: tetratricopeptide repeat protein [Treponema sp.]|jgi:tetratricopeptide (TPR) repeat protein|nr:tetratricopeptide repeat protein [Treponema sp.]